MTNGLRKSEREQMQILREELGAGIELTIVQRKKHKIVLWPGGGRTTIAGSPGDAHSLNNFRAAIRRWRVQHTGGAS